MKDGDQAATASFAAFLANLAVPEEGVLRIQEADRWDFDELAEDVATISGVALQADKTSGRPAEGSALSKVSESRTPPHRRGPVDGDPGPGAPIFVPVEPPKRLSSVEGGSAPRKTASVTIRMKHEECAQLHERAAAAGMTVSAYLRLCIFEAEALRAQVKEALAQFNAASAADRGAPEKQVASISGWRSRFFPRRSGHCPSARAQVRLSQ